MKASEGAAARSVRAEGTDATREAALLAGRFSMWLAVRRNVPPPSEPSEMLAWLRSELAVLETEWKAESGRSYDSEKLNRLNGIQHSLAELHYAVGETCWAADEREQAMKEWTGLPKAFHPWTYLYRSRQSEAAGETAAAIVYAKAMTCSPGTLLYLEKHWRLYRLYAALGEAASAESHLRDVLRSEPDYEDAAEEAYRFWTAGGNFVIAFEHCTEQYVRAPGDIWADRAIRLLTEVGEIASFAPCRTLLEALFRDGRLERWSQAANTAYDAVPYEALDELAAYVKATLLPTVRQSAIVPRLADAVELLAELSGLFDGDGELRERHSADIAWIMMVYGLLLRRRAAAFEGGVRLQVALEKGDPGDARRALLDQTLLRVGVPSEEDPVAADFPWLHEVEKLAEAIEDCGGNGEPFRRLVRWERDPNYRIMLIGTFNNGKSSLINALVGGKVLKTKSLPTTSMLVFLSAGEQEAAELFRPDAGETQKVPWERVAELTAFNAERNPGEDWLARLRLPNAWLADNRLALIDTPGFLDFSNQAKLVNEHAEAADRIVMVIDATKPLTGSESDILRGLLALPDMEPDRFAFVLNKSDMLDPEELDDIVAHVRGGLSELLGSEPPLFVFNSRDPSMAERLRRDFAGLIPPRPYAVRFERFASRFAEAMAEEERAASERTSAMRGQAERYRALTERLETQREDVRGELTKLQRTLAAEHAALKGRLERYVHEQLPALMEQQTDRVYIGFDYKTLREQVERKLQEIVRAWAEEHVTPQLRENVAGLMQRIQPSYEAMQYCVDRAMARRLLALGEESEFDERRAVVSEPVPWLGIVQAASEPARRFVDSQTYSVRVLGSGGMFAGLFHGISSFFNGTNKVLEDVRSELRREISDSGGKTAERLHAAAFSSYSGFADALSAAVRKLPDEAAHLLKGDTKLVETRAEELFRSAAELERERERMAEAFADARHRMKLWTCQVSRGVIIENGQLCRMA
ncbi:dynamin family protein [Paenibacillus sp.]|uniref:dynamin family protein n=1 Tax=Paenibacillus sp. TaxID=58172 RepID=UPI002D2759A2|nr:dynamin family protein [Paenibacillus sp.]HZG85594.1 dynamin family protein [Paenibacillus sp.]